MAARPVAVVLLSGGIDSATAMAVARSEGFDVAALSVDYGQRHRGELEAAGAVARALGAVEHKVVRVDLRAFGGSALTDEAVAVPKDSPDAGRAGAPVPVTYVPARNLVLLSIAAAWAETLGSADVYIGANAVDYSGYPDCREPFLRAFETAATLGTRAGTEGGRPLRVHAPLVTLTKAQIIQLGTRLGVDYGLTRSCYDPTPEGLACGRCDSCLIRARGFREAGVADPTRYAARPATAAAP
jgi:7-cyano-7-deazaguanine synthase